MNQPAHHAAPAIRQHPPKVSLTFRVGVVGHRPNRLTSVDHEALESAISTILDCVKKTVNECHHDERELYDGDEIKLVALSSLAEGVDRLFADNAQKRGYELASVLPFTQEEYAKDFKNDQSRDQFDELLTKSKSIFELDGSRNDEEYAYGTAGKVVLNQSDLLIVVWDGERKHLLGGTEEILDAALLRRSPIIWIDAAQPHRWQILQDPLPNLHPRHPNQRVELTSFSSEADLVKLIKRLVMLPQEAGTSHGQGGHDAELHENSLKSIRVYYAERQHKYNLLAFWWKLFRDILGEFKFRMPKWRVAPYEPLSNAQLSSSTHSTTASSVDRIQPYFCWADRLADRYSDAYRSAFIVAFFLAAFSVAMALGPIVFLRGHGGKLSVIMAVLELVAISTIVIVVFIGRLNQWHRRWLNYRLLAETLRHQQLVINLGGAHASPSTPSHLDSYGDPGASWMGWYARAVERSLGLPVAIVERPYIERCLNDLKEQLDGPNGQIHFHELNSARSSRIEGFLHLAEKILFSFTLLFCFLHVMHCFLHADHVTESGYLNISLSECLTFLCGFLPALGAALAGINQQGEFRRIKHRNYSMSKRLKQQLEKVHPIQSKLSNPQFQGVQISPEVANVATETARIMVQEVLDWRVIFQDQPLKTT